MGIYIPNMEMPKENEILVFDVWHGKMYARYTANTGARRYEVVSLPEGHGRLGDLDSLQEEFKKSHDGKRLMLIDTAPTIIEADLEWKMKNCCCFSNTDQAEGDTE